MSRFEGRRALVTGGTKGIGAAVADRLAAEGAEVVVAARTVDGCPHPAVALDIADPEAVAAAVAAHGPFDVLVANAGIDDVGWFTDYTPARWRRVIAVNLEGTIACCQAVLGAMQAARYGRIVIVSSEAGRIGSKCNAVYAATKAAQIALAKSLARENARYGITVNAAIPGPIQTPMLDANRGLPNGEQIVAAMVAMTQIGRLGTVAEAAAVICFLASEEASYVTGESLGVSGGMGLGG